MLERLNIKSHIYNKQPTDITTQLAMLKQRGLIVSDEDTALKQLTSISYFRLASYWKIFEIDEATHQFANGTCLEDVISLYTFDRELRSIIFTAIQDIEVALRTRIIHFFSMTQVFSKPIRTPSPGKWAFLVVGRTNRYGNRLNLGNMQFWFLKKASAVMQNVNIFHKPWNNFTPTMA